jgi:CDP-diacylglycerol pyrophosphatase
MPMKTHHGLRLLAALGAICLPLACAANPNALWEIVHDYCEPAAEGAHVQQKCADVNLAGGYAVLKDIVGIAQYLLIPTARVSGIESPELLAPNAPNYFRDAWNARGYVNRKLHRTLPRDEVSLAINSESGRSQDQLHIHIDCLAHDVAQTLREVGPMIGTKWAPLPVRLRGHVYSAMRIDDADLAHTDPFKLVAPYAASRNQTMGEQTLLLTGTTRADGAPAFFLLNDHVQPGNWASSEELQDHTCSLADRSIEKA